MSTTSNRRVTVSEIAHIASVGVSAVSNWRKRYRDFPAPIESSASGDMFDFSSVVSWLELHGRTPHASVPSVDRELWAIMEAMRGTMTSEESVLAILQVLYVRIRGRRVAGIPNAGTTISTLSGLAAAGPEGARDRWERLVEQLADTRGDELRRVLALPVGLSDRALWDLVRGMTALPAEDVQWGPVITALLKRTQGAMLGRAYGGFATPASITNLMTQLLAPIEGVVYDPASGHAMVLAEAAQQAASANARFVGQEVNEWSWRVGYLHLALQGVEFILAAGDTLRDDKFRSLRADRVVLEPPFGQRFNSQETFLDERWQFGTSSSAEWMWAQHLLFHLAASGVGVMTVPIGTLSRSGRDAHIRRGILSADVLDAVIELPPGLIPGASIAVALLIFQPHRPGRSKSVLFVDARQLGIVRRGKAHELTTEDLERILETVSRWRDGSFEDETLFAAAATSEAILDGDVDLSPRRFVRYAAPSGSEDIAAAAQRLDDAKVAARSALETLTGVNDRVESAVEALHPTEGSLWVTVKLRTLLDAAPHTGTRQEQGGTEPARPWIATRLVTGGTGRLAHVPEEETRARVKGRLARRGDILLASRGVAPNGRIGCATVEFDGEAAFAESLMLLSPDASRVDPDFLRLSLTSSSGRIALSAATTGTVIGNLRRDALGEVEIQLPDLATQRRIVEAMRPVEDALVQLSAASEASQTLFDSLRDEIAAGRCDAPPETHAARISRPSSPAAANKRRPTS